MFWKKKKAKQYNVCNILPMYKDTLFEKILSNFSGLRDHIVMHTVNYVKHTL